MSKVKLPPLAPAVEDEKPTGDRIGGVQFFSKGQPNPLTDTDDEDSAPIMPQYLDWQEGAGSEAINGFRYDRDRQVLTIQFRGSLTKYEYENVPESVCQALAEAKSKGQFYGRNIRRKYRCGLVLEPQGPPPATTADSPNSTSNPPAAKKGNEVTQEQVYEQRNHILTAVCSPKIPGRGGLQASLQLMTMIYQQPDTIEKFRYESLHPDMFGALVHMYFQPIRLVARAIWLAAEERRQATVHDILAQYPQRRGWEWRPDQLLAVFLIVRKNMIVTGLYPERVADWVVTYYDYALREDSPFVVRPRIIPRREEYAVYDQDGNGTELKLNLPDSYQVK